MKDLKNLKVALVHEYLTTLGGAEKVLWYLHEIFPEAPIYTNVYFENKCGDVFGECDIRQSFISKLPFQKLLFHQYKLFYYMAMEKFDFREYDLVISSVGGGHGNAIITPTDCLQISYVNNVPRYLWHLPTSLHGSLWRGWENLILPPIEHYWRIKDRLSSERPDNMFSNSKVAQQRIKKFYRRDSTIVYPPVELDRFLENPVKKGNYFCYFGRIEKYKNIDMAIRACIKNKNRLKIVGSGNYEKDLKKLVNDLKAEKLIEFMGRLPDDDLEDVLGGSMGFVFPCQSEEFGIVIVEAMAAGKPVIAFESVGSKEIIQKGKTGILVKEFSVDALSKALKQVKRKRFSPDNCRRRAQKFSVEAFKKGIVKNVKTWRSE
jgi:glycosyltransferase involved in cell wall biosynthesis